jgi:hypothetical protein
MRIVLANNNGQRRSKVNQLTAGQCGLKDVSSAGDWHLPSIKELQSLIDFSQYNPALPKDHPFSSVQTNGYWSSTESAGFTSSAWFVNLFNGFVSIYGKGYTLYVWPVVASA